MTSIQGKIKRIQEIARYLQRLEQDDLALFEELNALSKDVIAGLLEEYEVVKQSFQPINLLRYEVLNQLQEERPPLSADDVDLYRNRIEQKDTEYFRKYGTKVVDDMINDEKTNSFNPYQRKGKTLYFRLLYTIFYRRQESNLITRTLEEIGHTVASYIGLTDYRIHRVDFRGSTNFGSLHCWVALFPSQFPSIQRGHHLFLKIQPDQINAGLWAGEANEPSFEGSVSSFKSLDAALKFLEKLKTNYYRLNQQTPSVTQYALPESLPLVAEPLPAYLPAPYGKTEALEEVFVSAEQWGEWQDALQYKRNLILQGPPGVGKSYLAKRLAYGLLGFRDESRIETVQFHQSYAYEDFMQGHRPDGTGGFYLKNGVFYEFCQRARLSPEPYVFIIDEINRGNLSRIFGELLQLLEADKRGPAYAVTLTYSGESFFVPPNVYVIGTMNTADRSLALVDYALRRRFAFADVSPAFGEKFREFIENQGLSSGFTEKIIHKLEDINKVIHNDASLGRGFLIGHSYFVHPELPEDRWFKRVIHMEIAPLLREYWFDQPDRAEDQIEQLLD